MKYIKLILVGLAFCTFLIGCSRKEQAEDEIEVYGYEPPDNSDVVIENDNLEFHFNTDTTQFYIVRKGSDDIWYSNPQDAADDPIADNSSKDALLSTLSILYSTSAGVTTTLNNYSYSIVKGIYSYEVLDNGIKVDYSIGDIERTYCLPIAVPESRMLQFYDKLEKSDQRQIDEYYRRYDINNLRATEDKNSLLSRYPDLAKERVYVLRDSIAEYLKVKIEDIFIKAGYTAADYETDLARYSTLTVSDNPVFNISIVYELESDNLVVSIPYEDIQFSSEFPITSVKVLPYFGAGGTQEEGYMMVPDGSGGIINYNNGKSTQNAYSNTVYGWDYSVKRDALIDENRAVFPVFGIAKSNSSMLCILEEGAPYATIEADVSGRLNSYNYVDANYTVVHGEIMDISSKSDKTVKVYEDSLPEETLQQRYYFIDSASYVDMAAKYREYLIEHYPELAEKEKAELPVAVEIIAATDRVKQRLGFPVTVAEPLTTYKEAAAMVKKLSDAGFTNMSINLNGWFNQGVVPKVPDKVKLISGLGSKKDFTNMLQEIENTGSKLYLQSSFQFIYKNGLLDGFYANRDAAKHVSRELVKLYPYSAVWYGKMEIADQMYYLAKPGYSMKLINSFQKQINKLGAQNIAFGDTGRYLSGDYNPKASVSRQEVMNMQTADLKELYEAGAKIMVYSGNSYTVPYTDFILDMKLDSKGFNIIDEEIPFYQIALHGVVPYAGEAINLAENYKKNLLKTIETGAGLYFLFMDEPTATLQESNYTKYYGADFSLVFDSSTELYQELKTKLEGIYGQYIVDHQKLAEGVYMTVYEDGTKAIVNYNSFDYSYKGKIISAEDYLIEGSGE